LREFVVNAGRINRFGIVRTDECVVVCGRIEPRMSGTPGALVGVIQHAAVEIAQTGRGVLEHAFRRRDERGRSAAGPATLDAATIDAARLGDRAARASLLGALQDPWYRFSLSLLRDPDLAGDAVQETAVRFLRQLPSFRGESQLRTWSLGIALNVVREIRRKRRNDGTLPEDDAAAMTPPAAVGREPQTPGGAADLSEQRDRLREVLEELPERQREAVLLRFFEDLSVEETAKAMDCAAGTVKATVHQALATLRRKLKVVLPR
jgi:RNA polymerase sigma-70 factor (ECF subfamily)